MTVPVDLYFRDLHETPELRDACDRNIARITRHFPDLQRIEVTLASPHHHSDRVRLVSVHVEAHVPSGPNLVVSHEHHDKQEHVAGEIAVRDAFRALHRQLEGWRDKRNGHVKTH